EQIEAEYSTREEATKRQIMAEIDARLRNERISLETSLDLVRQETALDLEVEMEQRLGEFRERKEREVVEQLERQMSKREEIMRNKALIEVRRREAEMRAEIEAALAVKRQEIKERLATLEARSDEFKQLAEDRLRKDIEKDLISDEDLEREALVAQLESKEEASEQDALLAKREAWMGALGTARSQTPAGAAGTLGLGSQNQALGSQSATLGAAAMTGLNVPGQSMPLGGGLAAPVRSPIGQSRPMTALGAAAAQKDGISTTLGARPLGQSAPLAPARAPIGGTAAPLGAPQADTPGFLGSKSVVKPIQPNDSELESREESDEEQQEDTEIVFEESASVPPGGGKMIRSGGPSVKSPPVKGPPGGGRMVRKPVASPQVKGPPVRKTIQPEPESVEPEMDENNLAKLVPASDRRLLTPTSTEETASIKPVRTLQPVGDDENTKTSSIRPVKVMKVLPSEEE
ncbi:MAG: hypothetical protein VX804_02030, partial [Candidatus Thermoplasmatota archaeon]|nr:hypothetical protein [Candidatus Thermoplasmatota archaeon]